MRRSANGHLLTRAIKHGVTGSWIERLELAYKRLELAYNMSLVRAEPPV